MTIKIQATPNRKVLGNVAFRAYQIGDQDVVGGNPLPYYPVMDPDLIENGGEFKVAGNNPNQFLVYVTTGEVPLGGAATPIYIVNSTPVNPPNPPSNLVATAVSSSQIDLVWVDNSSDETGFRIYRDGIEIDTVGAGVTTYNDTGLNPATEYEYYVTAFNINGESTLSNTDTATTDFVGAYDGIPNLVHVYEAARRTLSAYTGPLVRIRRSSDNAEMNFGYVTNGDLDTAAITTFLGGSNGFVVTVYDQVGSNNPTQATAGNQPGYAASGQNGKPVARFNGTSHFLRIAYSAALSQPFSLYCVAKADSISGGFDTIVDGDDISNRNQVGKDNSGPPNKRLILAGSTLVGTGISIIYEVWSTLFNGASSSLWINGVVDAAGNAGTQNPDGIAIGSRYDGTSSYWDGDIASAIVADPSHSTAQREAMQDAINDYWSIY